MVSPLDAAWAIFPLATVEVARSIIAASSPMGIPAAIGLVDTRGVLPPQAGITAGPLVNASPIISAFTISRT